MESILKTYPCIAGAEYLLHTDYDIRVRQNGGGWQKLPVYTVQIDPDYVQNMQPDDEYKDSPLVYFDFSDEAEIRIRRFSRPIAQANVHPESRRIPAVVQEDGTVTVRLHEPKPVCVSLDGDRQEMVYLMVSPPETDLPPVEDPSVIRLRPGVTQAPPVGHDVWKGGIREAYAYTRCLSAEELTQLSIGKAAAQPLHHWAFDTPLTDKEAPLHHAHMAELAGYPALVLDGVYDALPVAGSLHIADGDFTLSLWIYRAKEDLPANRTLLATYLQVRADGYPTTLLNDWQYPFAANRPIPYERWTHLALVRSADTLTFYIDGEHAGSCTAKIEPAERGLLFGASCVSRALVLQDGQTLYIPGDALLDGSVIANGARSVTIRGRGLIDLSRTDYRLRMKGITLTHCTDCHIEGVITNHPRSMCTHLCGCDGVTIRRYKAFSSYGATDGINMKASRNIDIEDCFIRSNDDCLSVYATIVNYQGGSEHIYARDCVLINDAGHAIMSGIHGNPHGDDVIRDLRFENLDVVDSKCQYADYQGVIGLNVGNDVLIEDVVCRDIRVENIRLNQLFNLRVFYNPVYCETAGRGVRRVRIEDVRYTGDYTGHIEPSRIAGDNEERLVEDIVFRHIVLNGAVCRSLEEAHILVGDHTARIALEE